MATHSSTRTRLLTVAAAQSEHNFWLSGPNVIDHAKDNSMTVKQSFKVAVAGLDIRDVRLIEIVFKHSQYNRYEFKLVNEISPGTLDLLIANAHDDDGKAAIFKLRAGDVPIPIIAAVPRGEASTAKHAISIDRLTLQLLPILNRVVELDLLSPETQPMDRRARSNFAAAERVKLAGEMNNVRSFGAPKNFEAPANLNTTDLIATRGAGQPNPYDSVQTAPRQASQSSTQSNVASQLIQAQFTQPQVAQHDVAQHDVAQPQGQEARPTARTNLVSFPGSRNVSNVRQKLRVLIVDDSPTVRQQLGGALEKIGFHVVLAATGIDALNLLDKEHYDLALVDVVMPEMDGYKLTREIKKVKSRKSMPVIILTSKSSPFDLARGALAGCDSFLSKPVPLRELQNAIVKHLRKSLAIDDLSEMLNLNGSAGLSPQKAMTEAHRATNSNTNTQSV